MENNPHVKERWQLLQNLRYTVEGLLIDGVSNVWNVYGGLNRLHNTMEQIFQHGCRIFHPSGEPDCWTFIEGLNWLQPSLATTPTVSEPEDYFSNLPTKITSQKDSFWLYKSLENHSLSQKLLWLLSNKEHLLSCLEPWGFLCQTDLAEATLTCLKAVERNQPNILTEIDPSLFLSNWIPTKPVRRKHYRSSSFPINYTMSLNTDTIDSTYAQEVDNLNKLETSSTKSYESERCLIGEQKNSTECKNALIKTWNSLPTLSNDHEKNKEKLSNEAFSPTVELSKIININYFESKDSNSDNQYKPKSTTQLKKIESVKKIEINSLKKSRRTSKQYKSKSLFMSGSSPETIPWPLQTEGQRNVKLAKKSFIENGGNNIQPMSTGYFPRPLEGQSLMSFLSSAQFSRANAELDRENAHFSISEAMIAAIEQIKCNKQWRLIDETVEESDEEINHLKQRIRLRRRQRQEERCRVKMWQRDLLSDGKTDTTTTDQSISPLSTSSRTSSDNVSTDDVEDLELDDTHNESRLKSSGLSVSMASLYSSADIHQSSLPKQGVESVLVESFMSAEGVALSLISRFNEKQLPRASELQWLVSEDDAPQQLLPLPKSWPVNPDEPEIDHIKQLIPLRGTIEWAPPRPQIIFTLHPTPVRKTLIAKQNYRCAGCGMKVAIKYSNKFRYCEYLGRYFCTGCHANQVSLIPGKILSKWDFKRYPVSNFSYRLLDQMMSDPLFHINDLCPTLFKRIKLLEKTKILRTQLFLLKDFILNCRFASSLQEMLKKESEYIYNDPNNYSLQDMLNVKLGALPIRLQEYVRVFCSHVVDCELCKARGFVCEFCYSKDVIFPWELSKTVRCDSCGACFHRSCKEASLKTNCPRCTRLKARRISREESL